MKLFFVVLLYSTFMVSCDIEEEPLREFKINVGGQFTIQLEANWSTGYSWKWENRLEVSVVDTTDRTYIQSNPGLGGTSGVEKWTFIGKCAGTESIKFLYFQADSQESEPLETREYLVYVIPS